MTQLELKFTTPYLEVAKQPGMTWVPKTATPEEVKEWDNTDRKFWADHAGHIVIGATIVQFSMLGFMFLTFAAIEFYMNI